MPASDIKTSAELRMEATLSSLNPGHLKPHRSTKNNLIGGNSYGSLPPNLDELFSRTADELDGIVTSYKAAVAEVNANSHLTADGKRAAIAELKVQKEKSLRTAYGKYETGSAVAMKKNGFLVPARIPLYGELADAEMMRSRQESAREIRDRLKDMTPEEREDLVATSVEAGDRTVLAAIDADPLGKLKPLVRPEFMVKARTTLTAKNNPEGYRIAQAISAAATDQHFNLQACLAAIGTLRDSQRGE